MRDRKLDRHCSNALRPVRERAPVGVRWPGLRRIVDRDARGTCRWLRCGSVLVVVLVLGGALWLTGLPWRFTDRSPCADAFAAQQWLEASTRCAREVARTGASVPGVREAAALRQLGRDDEALAAARRWFGSGDDAMARQIAGAVYLERKEPLQAIAMLEQARAAHLRRADHVEAARDHSYLAGAFKDAGLLGDAVRAAEAAVREADLASPDERSAQLRGRARRTLGKILIEIGDYATARMMLWEAQQQLAAWPADQAWVFLQLAMLLQAEDDQASAAVLFERTLELAAKAGVAPVMTSARLNLAYARRELGQLDAAEQRMSELDDEMRGRPTALFVAGLIAADRGQRARAEQLLARAAAAAPTDDYAMDIALQRGRLAERTSDRAAAERHYRAAIGFVETLRQNTSSLGLRPLVLARRRAPYRRLLALLARQGRRLDALVVAEQLHARAWLDALVGHAGDRAGREPPTTAASLGQPRGYLGEAPSLDALLAVLKGREVLMFAEAESDLWRFHIVDGAVALLDRLPERTRALLERGREAPDDLALAAELGELLVPAAARGPSPRPLYIVAGGALGAVPFAALRRDGRFLIEDRVLSRLPGVVALRCRRHPEAQRSAVFLGDSRDDLPAAREETHALAHASAGTAFVGAEASVARLDASRGAALLHLAVHAEADPSGARLLLADGQQVSVADIVERGIGPRVAVLAGCATAIGHDPEGWGALSSAFLAAGSRSVVATLQPVIDADALEIMRRFYLHGGDRRPAMALARAQRELLATTLPSVWGAFVVHGSAEASDCVARDRDEPAPGVGTE